MSTLAQILRIFKEWDITGGDMKEVWVYVESNVEVHLFRFQRMRSHLGVKEADPAKFPADKLAAVAELLRKSTSLQVSDDGEFLKAFFVVK
jgi:hypothetical protein